jgi:hypothetical protein
VERWFERSAKRLRRHSSRVPFVAATVAGAGAFALGSAVGVAEIVFGAAAFYVVLRMLRDHVDAEQAMREGLGVSVSMTDPINRAGA